MLPKSLYFDIVQDKCHISTKETYWKNIESNDLKPPIILEFKHVFSVLNEYKYVITHCHIMKPIFCYKISVHLFCKCNCIKLT